MASKLTTSFINISNVLERNGRPEIYKLYKSMLNEEELERLSTIEMIRGMRKQSKTINRLATEASSVKKRGRKKKVVEVVESDTPLEEKVQEEPHEITNPEPEQLV